MQQKRTYVTICNSPEGRKCVGKWLRLNLSVDDQWHFMITICMFYMVYFSVDCRLKANRIVLYACSEHRWNKCRTVYVFTKLVEFLYRLGPVYFAEE